MEIQAVFRFRHLLGQRAIGFSFLLKVVGPRGNEALASLLKWAGVAVTVYLGAYKLPKAGQNQNSPSKIAFVFQPKNVRSLARLV